MRFVIRIDDKMMTAALEPDNHTYISAGSHHLYVESHLPSTK